jgi:hypothetical protein
MPDTEDKRQRCVVCSAPFQPNRWWQRYCSAFCCSEFHRRERLAMRQWWKAQQHDDSVERRMALVEEALHAHEVAEAEPIRRRL